MCAGLRTIIAYFKIEKNKNVSYFKIGEIEGTDEQSLMSIDISIMELLKREIIIEFQNIYINQNDIRNYIEFFKMPEGREY
jgi:hypothetical protein